MTAGGYQKPSNPAPVSLPGKLSSRTDGGPGSRQVAAYVAGGDYGDGGLLGIQQGAPLAASGGTPAAGSSQDGQAQPVPLSVPSQRPGEPVTAGADAGPGAGSESLGLAPTLQSQGLQDALNLLQSLGTKVSPQVTNIRNALTAHMSNQAKS